MATTTAHTEIPGNAPPFPPFDKETFPSQILCFALTFAALYLITSRLALPRIDLILTKRRQHIAGDFHEAERLKRESDATLAAYEKTLAAYEKELMEARSRAQALFNQLCQRQAADEEAARKALDVRLDTPIAEAEKRIAASKAAAMRHVREITTEATIAIVARLLGRAPADGAVAAAVNKALKP
jgi:F-type H+-transporting ATPase subunit b